MNYDALTRLINGVFCVRYVTVIDTRHAYDTCRTHYV